MTFKINGQSYRVPNSLDDISLGERVGYEKEHGKLLREAAGKILAIKDDQLRDLEFTLHYVDQACRSVSYWGKIPLDIVQQTAIDDVLAVYNTAVKLYAEDVNFASTEQALLHEFEWEGETWAIHPVEIKHGSPMNFGELVDSKQIVQDAYGLGEGRWECLVSLCTIFFRKKGEAYDKNFPDAEGDRYKLMLTLPLSYALHVGFFLSGIMTTYSASFLSSGRREPALVENP